MDPRDEHGRGSERCPVLVLVLEGCRPRAGAARFPLLGLARVRIGRGSERRFDTSEGTEGEASLRIPDEWMSSAHAVLARERGRWLLEDPGSKNGVKVNGETQLRTALSSGDLIEVGKTVLLFHHGEPSVGFDEAAIIGLRTRKPALARTFDELTRAARSTMTILVHGETGTGKELAARAIHELSGRSGAFVAVNCGALSDSVLASELFGYKKGAFSGADSDRRGLIEVSSAGTLFLDEIGDLSTSAQAALLRAVQEQQVRPVGATDVVDVDLRVVAASHKDLEALVAAGQFREDLLARLTGFRIVLPPLRERLEDLGDIVAALLERHAGEVADTLTLEPDVIRAMVRYRWPRNIRELAKALERAIAMANDGSIRLSHTPPELAEALRQAPAAAKPELSEAEQARRERLIALLTEHGGNISAVAREMGKVRAQIQRWIKRYEIDLARLEP